MIDIHCHVVPNIDDGAKDLEDALEMARIAYNEGIRKIVNTSHYHPSFEYKKGNELLEDIKEFNNILKSNNINIEIYIGNELYYSEDMIDIIEQKEFYTLNNSKYLLIEFPPIRFPKNLVDIIYEIKIRGYIPILAHVERYKEVQENVNLIYDCINEGALIQVNSSSIIGKNGKEAKRVSQILLDNNMVHFIATDAHSSQRRRPMIKETYDYVCSKYGDKTAEILFIENPSKVILNEDINIKSPIKYNKPKGFLQKLFKK
ncbi:MAG TPA: hypothetical protein K8V90_09150 [Romboutsia timonensis]|uniref:protein-tyrosine-phosphatase n=1 Tax=Romboutsia timonensis TaxID=1776391 RepID=A0A921T075_9FIRM|nr:CpsB/CapC family capsule biosynthesis tyrosine phosphatase [uncultured Romboutsia sp.]HJG97253.1 hypothetical protein [Romboutsia timonensis]